MLKKSDTDIIAQYVDEKYFDREKIIKYLNMHSVVGNEIFLYCDEKAGRDESISYSSWLDNEYGYQPLTVEKFIRRIPFYFFVNDYSNDRVGDLGNLISGLIREDKDKAKLEELYQSLEYMFYEKKISLPDIFCYMVDQTNYVGNIEMFFRWKHYLQLCGELGNDCYFPDCFITSYNELLEKKGLPPVIYEIGEIGLGEISWRTGTQIEFEGTFPCDKNGHPILKWVGLRIKNAKSITCSQKKSHRGRLFVEITPNTTIHALNCYNDKGDDDFWYHTNLQLR